MTPVDAKAREWDVIVIGAGMGGGLVGRQLTSRKQSVLFVEKGASGPRKEQHGLGAGISDPVARHIRGIWPTQVSAEIDGEKQSFFAPIGSGVGGSSVFYAGALERPERHDIEPTDDMEHPTQGWPVTYADLQPYYEQAEQMLHIAGEPDPLSNGITFNLAPALPAKAGELALMESFRTRGLHPYRQHIAIRNLPGCQLCVGHKCPQNCKMDGRSGGVEPALDSGYAALLSDCTVTSIVTEAGQVSGIEVTDGDSSVTLKAKVYVLAAGALGSPHLLLKSTAQNPEGCANSSGWVGRGLMFHINEMFALWPHRSQKFEGASKAISLRDLYTFKGQRLGLIQSLGLEASYGNIVHYLNGLYDRSPLRKLKRLRYVSNLVAAIATRMLGNAKIFVGIMEDLAYPENRMIVDPDHPDRLSFQYTISPELKTRRKLFRRQIKAAFRSHWTLLLGQKLELNYGHPCGTLRFGDDPSSSVTDKNCKAHDLDNLYVADASFMPSSMGVNPSLTIAANALRVGDIIADQLGGDRAEPMKKEVRHA